MSVDSLWAIWIYQAISDATIKPTLSYKSYLGFNIL